MLLPIILYCFYLQQALLSLSSSLAISFLVADVACAKDNEDVKATLLSSTLLMNGLTTLFMVTLGIRYVHGITSEIRKVHNNDTI